MSVRDASSVVDGLQKSTVWRYINGLHVWAHCQGYHADTGALMLERERPNNQHEVEGKRGEARWWLSAEWGGNGTIGRDTIRDDPM